MISTLVVSSAGGFIETQKLTASDGAANDNFGFSLAISDGTIVVGAFVDDGFQGAAYVFGPAGAGGFAETQKLTASDGAAGDQFGRSVAASGGTIAVGAPFDDGLAGAAYVFISASPEDQLDALIDGVEQLVNDGSLNLGQGNSLASKLEGALQELQSGQTAVAINLLNAFINEVESLVEEGVLSSEEGDALISAANAIIDAILASS